MKKILFLMSAMLALTLTSFSQKQDHHTIIEKEWEKYYNQNKSENPYVSFQKAQIYDIKERYKESSGTYLVKARNQILSGIGLQIFVGGIDLVISNVYANKIMNTNINDTKEINRLTNQAITCYVGTGVLALVGLGFEISGICNIGKAGLSLNANGVGVKVNF